MPNPSAVTWLTCWWRQARKLAGEAVRVARSKLGLMAADSGAAIVEAARHVIPRRKESRLRCSSGDLAEEASPRAAPDSAASCEDHPAELR